jgi:hypothetical protein
MADLRHSALVTKADVREAVRAALVEREASVIEKICAETLDQVLGAHPFAETDEWIKPEVRRRAIAIATRKAELENLESRRLRRLGL